MRYSRICSDTCANLRKEEKRVKKGRGRKGGAEPLPEALDMPGCSISPAISSLEFQTDSGALTNALNGLSGPRGLDFFLAKAF